MTFLGILGLVVLLNVMLWSIIGIVREMSCGRRYLQLELAFGVQRWKWYIYYPYLKVTAKIIRKHPYSKIIF